MEIAILGTDDDVLALAQTALTLGDRVEWLSDLRPEDAHAWNALCPIVQPHADWEAVLDHGLADAVILGRGTCSDDERLDRLRRLVADGIPTLATYPIGTLVVPYFEVDMVRQDVGGLLRHFNPMLVRAAIERMKTWVLNGHETVGAIRQVSWERFVSEASRGGVLTALAQDVEAITSVVGPITKVSSVGPPAEAAQFASLNVQFVGTIEIAVHWAVATAANNIRAQVTLTGDQGQVVVTMVPHATSWQTVTSGDRNRVEENFCNEPVPQVELNSLKQALAAGRSLAGEFSTWDSATRSMEVVDTVKLSLERGRMVEIHHQQLTEQMAFRGMMSALGCGLLLFGSLVLLVVGVLGDSVGIPLVGRLIAWWPLMLLLILTFFLALQLVPLTRSGKKRESDD